MDAVCLQAFQQKIAELTSASGATRTTAAAAAAAAGGSRRPQVAESQLTMIVWYHYTHVLATSVVANCKHQCLTAIRYCFSLSAFDLVYFFSTTVYIWSVNLYTKIFHILLMFCLYPVCVQPQVTMQYYLMQHTSNVCMFIIYHVLWLIVTLGSGCGGWWSIIWLTFTDANCRHSDDACETRRHHSRESRCDH